MQIHNIYIKNFRGIKETEFTCDSLTAILGRNGAGKSTVLHAILAFYEIAFKPINEDFFQRNTDNTITIRLTYTQLSAKEQSLFRTYIDGGQFTVSKRIASEGGGKYYAASPQVKEFSDVRAAKSKSDINSKYKELKRLPEFQELPNARNADACLENMVEFEKTNPELCEMVESETQFIGPPSIGGGRLDNYTKFVFVPAVKEVKDELSGKGKSFLHQLLSLVVERKVNKRADVIELRRDFKERVSEVFSSDNLTELPTIGTDVSKLLGLYAPGAEFNLDWGEVSPPEIQLPPADATLTEDGFKGEISRKGHGLQRSLIFAILEYLGKLAPEPVEDADPDEREEPEKQFEQGLILGIEEPELYQHPLKCKYLFNLFCRLCKENDTQILYTTHSPHFVSLELFNQVRMVRKAPCGNGQLAASLCECNLSEVTAKAAQISETPMEKISEIAFRAKASNVIDTIIAEGFFSEAVVVVEGFGEVGCLWAVQEILDLKWLAQGIAVIPARGKNNIDRPVLVFSAFDIPTYFIFDGDSQNKNGNKKNNSIKANKRLLRLAQSKNDDEFPPTTVETCWACFSEELGRQIKAEIGDKYYQEISNEVKKELHIESTKQIFKNSDSAYMFTSLVYKRRLTLPTIENIANKITALIPK